MRFVVLLFVSVFLLSSCKFYDVVLLEKLTPGSREPYPISDKSSCAIKIKDLKTGNEIWTRDKKCVVLDKVGDTVVCFLNPIRK
jgi:hypothetical protein